MTTPRDAGAAAAQEPPAPAGSVLGPCASTLVGTAASAAVGGLAAVAALGSALPRLATPTGLTGAAVESAWVAAHLLLYPWGALRERHEVVDRFGTAGLPPVRRALLVGDVEAAGTPIVLVHGMLDNRAVFTVLRRQLRRRGFDRVVTVNYSPLTNDIRAAAVELGAEIEALVATTGYERVHVVGHSLGGLIARYYVQRLGGDARVHTLVTLGTPHRGSELARLLPVRLGRQLSPGSSLYRELDARARGLRTRFVAYWSDLDQVVVPHVHGRLDHPDLAARNVCVAGAGHMSIPLKGVDAHEIAALLSQLDPDGATVRQGVTTLPR